jgi:murein DD-endopeptidase MepM/ murein hydrolase activator NlpD
MRTSIQMTHKRLKKRQELGVWLLMFLSLSLPCATATAQAGSAAVRWQPVKLANGSPVLFQVAAATSVKSISGLWLGHNVTFFHVPKSKIWYGLAGVSLETKPGNYDLRLIENFANKRTAKLKKVVRVIQASYPKITVKVAKQYTEPNPQQLTAISADKMVKQRTFAAVSAERLWSGPFLAPVSEPVSDVFGTARVFNQEVQSRHQGLDYAAPPGTPVHAINGGVVILARPMFFEGNCVIVDHGQGLLSLYLHLSEFKVKEGEAVAAGQIIALSGGTGRATGPHLHLAVRWQGVYLNPAILLKLQMPSS